MFLRSFVTLIACFFVQSSGFAEGVEPIQEVFEPTGVFPTDQFGKVAVVQWNPVESVPVGVDSATGEAFKQRHRLELAEFVKQAAANGAEMIITSEFGIVGYPDIPELPSEEDNFRNRDDVKAYVETVPGPSSEFFGKLASELNVTIQFGLVEVDPITDNYHNTAVVVGPKGDVVAKHRKVHLFELEEEYLVAGTGPTIYDSAFGRIGLIICSDVYDFDLLDKYKAQKIEILSLSTSWAQYNTGMRYFKSAAVHVGSYLLAANQNYFPDSGVVNPNGSLQSHIRQSEGIAYGYLPRRN